jgi:hypothetical protein
MKIDTTPCFHKDNLNSFLIATFEKIWNPIHSSLVIIKYEKFKIKQHNANN